MFSDTSFSIIGAGRVGTAIGVLLKKAGHRILGCSARNPESLERAVNYLGCFSSTNIQDVYTGADAILISVPDAAIASVAESISDNGVAEGTVVVHVSGAFGLEPLMSLRHNGARLAAVHPLQAIPTVEAGINRIPGSWFGATSDPEIADWVESYVAALQGKVMWVPEEQRALYHSAAVVASNYLVVLASIVDEMGFDVIPYLPLMRGTLSNVDELGVMAALTGPVTRGDAGTVSEHLRAIRSRKLPDVEAAYRILGLRALRASLSGGRLDEESARAVRQVLEGD